VIGAHDYAPDFVSVDFTWSRFVTTRAHRFSLARRLGELAQTLPAIRELVRIGSADKIEVCWHRLTFLVKDA
jgi:hypothetical protein